MRKTTVIHMRRIINERRNYLSCIRAHYGDLNSVLETIMQTRFSLRNGLEGYNKRSC
jgi:hypothetical protein